MDDFKMVAVLAANPWFERALIMKYVHRGPNTDAEMYLIARGVTQRAASKFGFCGEPAMTGDRMYISFWWQWVHFYEANGAIHQWTSE